MTMPDRFPSCPISLNVTTTYGERSPARPTKARSAGSYQWLRFPRTQNDGLVRARNKKRRARKEGSSFGIREAGKNPWRAAAERGGLSFGPQDPRQWPSDARASLSVGGLARSPSWVRRFGLAAAPPLLSLALHQGGHRSCGALGFQNPLDVDSRRLSSSAPSFCGPSLQRRYPPSSLLRPLLTSPRLSARRSLRSKIC